MKLYTTAEQTAKLIELGVAKPRCATMFWRDNKEVTEINYTIGELIEMLPESLCTSSDDSCRYRLSIDTDACMWRVRYMNDFGDTLFATYDVDLINALCDMVIVAWAT